MASLLVLSLVALASPNAAACHCPGAQQPVDYVICFVRDLLKC